MGLPLVFPHPTVRVGEETLRGGEWTLGLPPSPKDRRTVCPYERAQEPEVNHLVVEGAPGDRGVEHEPRAYVEVREELGNVVPGAET